MTTKHFCVAGICVIFFATNYSDVAPAAEDFGFVSLFNGNDLDGWVIENDGQFAVQDGLLVVNKGTGWLRSEKQYTNFVLKIDFRFLDKKANSGIFVRTGPTSHDDDNGWPDNGYQVQCMDTIGGPNEKPCATMIPYGAPPFKSKSDLKVVAKVFHPTGEWNSYEITCDGEDLTVKLNGAIITTATDIKNLQGHVGIQGEHGRVQFRNLSIKAL